MHRNAPLTVEGRRRLCNRIEEDGYTIAQAAGSMHISRQTASKWWHRYLVSGLAGLEDRPSPPRSCPHRTPARLERRVVAEASRESSARRASARSSGCRRRPPTRSSSATTSAGSPIWTGRGAGDPSHRDRPRRRARPPRRRKLAKIPPGGGWRVHGRGWQRLGGKAARVGYGYIHSAVDAHSRLAYSEIHDDEQARTAIAFSLRAKAFFEARTAIERVLSDNGSCYRSKDSAAVLLVAGIKHTFTKPYHPATNGKVERFNRTLLDEWAYVRAYGSESARRKALDTWLHRYNHHRHHTAVGGPPISRVNNVVGYNN